MGEGSYILFMETKQAVTQIVKSSSWRKQLIEASQRGSLSDAELGQIVAMSRGQDDVQGYVDSLVAWSDSQGTSDAWFWHELQQRLA